MGLATAITGIQPQNATQLVVGAGESPQHRLDQGLQATGGMGVGKEEGGISVEFRPRALEHLTQVGGKVLGADPSLKYILARPAQVVDGGGRMGSGVTTKGWWDLRGSFCLSC